MFDKCQWLHEKLAVLPVIKYPFNTDELPLNGIYFFYQDGEYWGHGGHKNRIVRIGTHKGDNFRDRISQHYLLDMRKMEFDRNMQKPSDRSIFRKNLGRVLLNQDKDQYLSTWEIDFTKKSNRQDYGFKRDIAKEIQIEHKITEIMSTTFSFRFLIISNEEERIGKKGLESRLIGTVSRCKLCVPSSDWLGRFSPIQKIRQSGLWQVQHLHDPGLNTQDILVIEEAL
jgi:hypothetical protein